MQEEARASGVEQRKGEQRVEKCEEVGALCALMSSGTPSKAGGIHGVQRRRSVITWSVSMIGTWRTRKFAMRTIVIKIYSLFLVSKILWRTVMYGNGLV